MFFQFESPAEKSSGRYQREKHSLVLNISVLRFCAENQVVKKTEIHFSTSFGEPEKKASEVMSADSLQILL